METKEIKKKEEKIEPMACFGYFIVNNTSDRITIFEEIRNKKMINNVLKEGNLTKYEVEKTNGRCR